MMFQKAIMLRVKRKKLERGRENQNLQQAGSFEEPPAPPAPPPPPPPKKSKPYQAGSTVTK